MKEYKSKYKDIYIYGQVIQTLIGKSVIDGVSSPYEEGGETVHLSLRANSVRGYGRRNWQREKLESERGMVIILEKGDRNALIGVQDKVRDVVEVFLTTTLTTVQQEIVKRLIEQLKFNNIKVKVSSDEKRRGKYQRRWSQGDRIQREAGRSGQRDYTDYNDYNEPDDDSGW